MRFKLYGAAMAVWFLAACGLSEDSGKESSGVPENWTLAATKIADNLSGVVWADSHFVAVGSRIAANIFIGSYPVILTSPDGRTWTPRNVDADQLGHLNSVIWTGNKYLAPGSYSGSGSFKMTSTDAIHWETVSGSPSGNGGAGVAWTGNQFVIVGSVAGTSVKQEYAFISTSPDGVTWTGHSVGPARSLSSVVWTGSLLVAVGRDSVRGVILTSPDGVQWTPRTTTGEVPGLSAVAWSGTQLVAGGFGDTILVSADGIDWSKRAVGIFGFTDILWAGTQWASAGWNVTQASVDGALWTESRFSGSLSSTSINGLAWNGSKLLAVTSGGDVWLSP